MAKSNVIVKLYAGTMLVESYENVEDVVVNAGGLSFKIREKEGDEATTRSFKTNMRFLVEDTYTGSGEILC